MAASDEPLESRGPRRRLGLSSAVFLIVASMIGAGVFTTSGYALASLGSPERVLFAWALGAVAATCGALCYGALARAFPESGGEYLFLAQTIHPLAGVFAGWVSLLAGFTAPIAVAALGLQAYLESTFDLRVDPRLVGSGAILLAGVLHGLRLAPGVVAQNVAVASKLALIAIFLAIGMWRTPSVVLPGIAEKRPPLDLGALAVSLVWISFAYSGWNAAVYVAGEVRDPQRNLPRSLLIGTAIVALAYLALNAIFLYSAHEHELAGEAEVGAIAAHALGGPGLRRFLTLIVALGLFTAVSSMVMAGPRVYARMAQDGALPRGFAFEGEVPALSVALQVGLSIGVVWIAELRELLLYCGFTLGLCSAATVLGLVVLRVREGAEKVPVPGWPLVPAVYLAMTLYASTFLVLREPREAAIGAATVALGFGLHALLGRRRRKEANP